MKYKLEVMVKGGISRPSYGGNLDVWSNEQEPDFRKLAYDRLRATSFPEICPDDVVVKAARVAIR